MTYNLYADVIFINNFTMDFLLLALLRNVMRLEKRKGGVFLASILGAGYALAVTIFPISNPFLQGILTYVLMSMLMVIVAFGIKCRKELLKITAGLYLAAVIMAGLMELFSVSGISWYAEQLIFRNAFKRLPLFVYVPAAAGVFCLALFLWKAAKRTETDNGHLYKVMLYYQGKSQSLTAFMDTGNRLREPYTFQPVSVVFAESCTELFQTVSFVLYIPYQSVGKQDGLLPAVKADRMEIEKEGRTVVVEKPFIALSKAPLSQDGSYQMLLNEKMWS